MFIYKIIDATAVFTNNARKFHMYTYIWSVKSLYKININYTKIEKNDDYTLKIDQLELNYGHSFKLY